MQDQQREKQAAAMPIPGSPDSAKLDGRRATSPSVPTEPWIEKIDETTSVLWTCRDRSMRQVIKIITRTPLSKKQQAAGIPPAYRCAWLDCWDEARSNPGAQDLVRAYLMAPDTSLYIFGAVGTGKTFLASAIANGLLQAGRGVRFQTVSGLLLELRDTFAVEQTSELQVLYPLFEVEFLLLDELGDIARNESRQASAFAAARILTLLDRRWQEGRPTIMTSNLSLAELVEWVGDERVGSRIRGLCGERGIVELVGRDLRFDEIPEEVKV